MLDCWNPASAALMATARAFAALTASSAPVTLARSEMRWELANIAVAVVLLAAAAAAFALFLFRRRARELVLVYFGLFALLFGLRLLAALPTIQSVFDFSPSFWSYCIWAITCLIVLPLYLFLLQVVSEEIRVIFRWLAVAQGGFAMFGLAAAALGVSLQKLNNANSFMLLGILAAAALFSFVRRRALSGPVFNREVRIFVAGFVVWLLFVVHANLLGLGIVKGHNVEFVGLFIFVMALAYISAGRIFANEERLLSLNKELEIAHQIQSSILPQETPELKGLEIAACYAPMSAVAGDFYDFFCVDDCRITVLIADVTGHGVPAALIASMLKVAFAGQIAHAHDPARVLAGLNASLCGKFQDHFVTAACLYLDLERRLLRYSGAGHPPLLRISDTGKAEAVEQNGLLLGPFPEADYRFLELALAPGDCYLLYTDGAAEALGKDQQEFGKARLLEFLENHKDMPARKMTDELLARILQWSGNSRNSSGGTQDDDITLLALRIKHLS